MWKLSLKQNEEIIIKFYSGLLSKESELYNQIQNKINTQLHPILRKFTVRSYNLIIPYIGRKNWELAKLMGYFPL